MKITSSSCKILTAIAVLGGLASTNLNAASDTWNVSTGNWTAPGSWLGGNVPGATSGDTNTDIASFFLVTGGSETVTVDTYRNIGAMILNGRNRTISSGTLVISNSGSIAMNVNTGGSSTTGSTINSNIVLAGNASFTAGVASRFLRFGTAGSPSIVGTAGNQILTLDGVSNGNGSGVNRISSAIGNGTATSLGITKNGTGTWFLNGANTFTGPVTANNGTLVFESRASLYNATPASWTAANITANSGARLIYSVGGAGQFTSSDLDTLLGLGSVTGGIQTGSLVGVDTTGGNFTYASSIANTNSGANVLRFVKTGANTLTLTGSSSYSGGTVLASNGGNLRVENSFALGTGTMTIDGGTTEAVTLQLANNITIGNAISLSTSRTLLGGFAHIENVSGNNTINGSVTMASTLGYIRSTSGTLTLNGSLVQATSSRPWVFGGAGVTVVNAAIGSAVTKNDGGTLILNAASTYSGLTTVNAGTLLVNNTTGAGTGSGATTAAGTATLGGSGVVAGATTMSAGSFLSPGAVSGTTGKLTFANNTATALDISGLAGGANGGLVFQLDTVAVSDLVELSNANGVLTIGAGLLDIDDFNFSALAGFGPGIYTLFNTSQTINGTLGTALTGTLGGFDITLSFANTNQDLILTVAVPEPSSLALLAVGLGGLAAWRRKRKP